MCMNCLKGAWNRIKSTVTDRKLLNRLSPICFLVAISGIAGWGVFVAIPFLYNELPRWLEAFVICLGYFLALELFVNWLCMLLVDTSFRPSLNNSSVQRSRGFANQHQNFTMSHGKIKENENDFSANVDVQHDASRVISCDWDTPDAHEVHRHTSGDMEQEEKASFISSRDNIDGTMQPMSTRTHGRWWYCSKCQLNAPPRCHHCGLCNKCIIKRDHHCFVVARCIGFRNLRHFSVFVFYASLATVFAIVHALPYAYFKVIPNVAYVDLFYPVAIVRGLLGVINYVDMILIVLGWMLLGYLIFSAYTLIKLLNLVTSGKTTFEVSNRLDVMDERDIGGRLKGVYGRHWQWNFLVPLHWLYEPVDDPLTWPYLKYNGRYIS